MSARLQAARRSARIDSTDRLAVRTWLRLLACSTQLQNEIHGQLRSAHGSTLARFDLLAQLARFPEGVRLVELSRRLLMTGANVTLLTQQLEAEQLVTREPDPADGRALLLRLTAKGRRQFHTMAVTHRDWIRERLQVLSTAEQRMLLDLLTRLKDSLGLPASHAD